MSVFGYSQVVKWHLMNNIWRDTIFSRLVVAMQLQTVSLLLIIFKVVDAEYKTDVDAEVGFFSHGQNKKLKDISGKLENSVLKSKVEVLGEVLKKHVDNLRNDEKKHKLELAFLVDASSSVGEENFKSELQFVKKLLADFTVSPNQTRVTLITFASIGQVVREVDQISSHNPEHYKCNIMHHHVQYTGGGTYTLGAMLEAQAVFLHSRPSSRKALFLITDGYSNGGDPRPVASSLRSDGVTIFTFGIQNGNTAELFDMATTPGEEHSYILDSFAEFVALARRALHQDLAVGVYSPVSNNSLCEEACGENAFCACGLRTGQYACLCPPGHYGLGTADQEHPCLPCPNGTYNDGTAPGDVTMCIPCPDINHMTLGFAEGINDCVCKHGFIPNGTTCEMVQCSTLKPPKHGYFVRGWCSNVVNAGCGMRCKIGYTLIGSSVRLCQQDGTWSGSKTTCAVKRCPRPPTPKNGAVACFPQISVDEDFPLDTECRFSCQYGSHLIGSALRVCLPLGRWDGLPTSCKSTYCQPLPKVNNGTWEPEECMSRKKKLFGQICEMFCEDGYELHGVRVRECGAKGSWTNRKEITQCIDTSPPVMKCPNDIETTTDAGASYATVGWTEPVPHDNSKEPVLLWSQPATEIPMKVQIGITNISYIATDSSFNQFVCTFSITVIDVEPPLVEGCESPTPFYHKDNVSRNITWEEPQFYDNSKGKINVSTSHGFGAFPGGSTEVKYIASDLSGNNKTCLINITVLEHGCNSLIPHTIINCSTEKCNISCEEGYEFAEPNSTIEVQYPCENLFDTLPACSEIEAPNAIIQEGTLSLEPVMPEQCSNTTFLNQVALEVEQNIAEACENSLEGCSINGSVNAQCEDLLSEMEEHSNRLITRRRRKAPRKKLNVNFTIAGKNGMKRSHQRLNLFPKNKTTVLNLLGNRQFKLNIRKSQTICPPATMRKRHTCVKCPAGSFWNEKTQSCPACGIGKYQVLPGQRECLVCPPNTSTKKAHSRHLHDCKAICPPGKYGSTRGRHIVGRVGVKPCISCPIGWYQPQPGALSCIKCEKNMTTQHRGSFNESQCISDRTPCQISPCLNGGLCQHKNGLITCRCSPGFLGSFCETKINECSSNPCIHGDICTQSDEGYVCTCSLGYAGKKCEIDVDECVSNPCQNGGECIDRIGSYNCHCPPSFQGDFCEQNVDDCVGDPCGDGGHCVDGLGNYTCDCKEGYSGKYCEIDPCSENTFCENNSTCYLATNSSTPTYWCECLPGYKGKHCSEALDFCKSSPCLNNATCISDLATRNYVCACQPGYVGDMCQTYLLSNFTLHFPTSGTTNYVRLRGPHDPLNQVSVCLWMRTLDRHNYGTVFSYATKAHDNSFTLTDYNGLVLYVNGDRVVTDVTANDGAWHHICIEWSSTDGQWMLYKDGILKDGGVNLANNTFIPGEGILVLGQDQDRLGGGFNAAESFVGHLTQLDVWNHCIGETEIKGRANDCEDRKEGNVLNWREFRSSIHGKVQLNESPLCQGCVPPTVTPFSKINISSSGSVVRYTCEPGYKICHQGYEESSVELKCLVHGSWEDQSPVCKRLSCGFPGYFPSGWMLGRSYLYQDIVQYKCYGGLHLIGESTRRCQKDGTWSGEMPSCQAGTCPDILQPDHSTMWAIVDNVQTNHKMEFECSHGYELRGSHVLTCLQNGTWDRELPSCLPIVCPLPKLNPHTEVIVLTSSSSQNLNTSSPLFSIGTKITFTCKSGFKMNNTPGEWLCEDTGQWREDDTVSSCIEVVCLQLNAVSNGKTIGDSFTPGSLMEIKCDLGYTLEGSKQLKCLENGEWDNTAGSCKIITCPPVNTTHFSIDSASFNQSKVISCKSPLELAFKENIVVGGETQWICSNNGEWIDTLGHKVNITHWDCIVTEARQCSYPQGPSHGYILQNGGNKTLYNENEMLEVQCRQGYQLNGSNQTICKHDGTWTNSTLCTAVHCGHPITPRWTKLIRLSNLLYGSMAELGCLDGFQPFGDMSIRCQANKRWSRLRGRCVKLSCGKPAISEEMTIIGHSYLFNDSLIISCPSGKTLIDSRPLVCGKDGKWSHNPECTNLS